MNHNDTEGMKLMSADGHVFNHEEIMRMLNEPTVSHHVVKKNYYYKTRDGSNYYKYDDIQKRGYSLVNEKWVYSQIVTKYLRDHVDGLVSELERDYYFPDTYEVDTEREKKLCEAGLLGFVVGDALGVPFEFKTREQMRQTPFTDMTEYGTHHMPMGTWSDDTSMTLATMDSMIQNDSFDYDDIMKRFTMWLKRGDYTATDKVFDVGNTVLAALDEYSVGKDPVHCGRGYNYNNGNGSLMRMFPVAYYIWKNHLDEAEATKLVNDVSCLTHSHPISQLGCKIYCDYLGYLLDGEDRYYAYYLLQQNDYSQYYPQEAVDAYHRILDGSIIVEPQREISGSGYVVDSLEAAIWASFNSENYQEAVTKAINLGDDTDTVGAITGSMAGVMYGVENIPEKWIQAIKKVDAIRNLSDQFVDHSEIHPKVVETKESAKEL